MKKNIKIIKIELMEKCFKCFAENGLSSVSIRGLAKHCECNIEVFYTYFTNLDELITDSTAYCRSKVEDEFMDLAPEDLSGIDRFLDEVLYWTAENHGKKYRLMYRVYAHPKYWMPVRSFLKVSTSDTPNMPTHSKRRLVSRWTY